MMDRRRFLLTSVAGALVVPCGAEAQQTGKMYRIGLLSPARQLDPSEPGATTLIPIALRRLGYVEGQNLIVERRFGAEIARATGEEIPLYFFATAWREIVGRKSA